MCTWPIWNCHLAGGCKRHTTWAEDHASDKVFTELTVRSTVPTDSAIHTYLDNCNKCSQSW